MEIVLRRNVLKISVLNIKKLRILVRELKFDTIFCQNVKYLSMTLTCDVASSFVGKNKWTGIVQVNWCFN